MLKIERIYTKPLDLDGYRIFVDRLWCRGIHPTHAHVDYWAKAYAPSNELSKWYKHVTVTFPAFKQRYLTELRSNINVNDFVKLVAKKLKKGNVILLYGSKEVNQNNAVVLQDFIDKKLGLKPHDQGKDFVNFLYNDGITNRRNRLLRVVKYLKKHPQYKKDLGLTTKNSHIFKDGKKLRHFQLLIMARKFYLKK